MFQPAAETEKPNQKFNGHKKWRTIRFCATSIILATGKPSSAFILN
jgi:hypothetical protein